MFITGSASGHIELLERVRKHLVEDIGWTELEYDGNPSPSPADITDEVHLHLRAPGSSTGNEFFLNIQTESRLTDDSYGWRMNAAQDWETDISDQAQLGACEFVYFNTWQNDMDYWLFANTRRFILIVKCNTSYMSMYAGLFLPFALPSEYLRPFLLCGNTNALRPYNDANARNQMIANPSVGACYALNFATDAWLEIKNSDEGLSNMVINGNKDGVVWPHRSLRQTGDSNQGAGQAGNWNYNGFFLVRPNANDESPQFLCHLISNTENWMLGTLEGVYACAGFGRTSEQELTMDDRTYLVFQNIFRTTPRDFMSIEEY